MRKLETTVRIRKRVTEQIERKRQRNRFPSETNMCKKDD